MRTNVLTFLLVLTSLLVGCSDADYTQYPEQLNENTALKDGAALQSTAEINAGTTQQIIRGYGGANIIGWRDDLTAEERIKAFSNWSGIGLSVVRVRISPDSDAWEDNKATIDKCKFYGGMAIASAWTAPASMKDNNSLIGGALKESAYDDYAEHLSSFNTTVGGVSAISPINEPNITVSYESMELTASEVADFVADQGDNCGSSIMAPEPYNMSKSYINTYLSNTSAASKTSYISAHIYGATPYYYNFGKEMWMTEHITDEDDGNTWSSALNTAKEIHDCMYVGYSMWVWWYIKRYYGLIDEDGDITKRGYAVAQFARYVRPGYYKISCTANPTSGVYTTAYKSGSTLVVVAINTNSSTTYQSFSINDMSVSGFNRYKTTSSSNLSYDSFTISDDSFGINLPASSITTLVSQ